MLLMSHVGDSTGHSMKLTQQMFWLEKNFFSKCNAQLKDKVNKTRPFLQMFHNKCLQGKEGITPFELLEDY